MSLFRFMENVATVIPKKWRRVGMTLGIRQAQLDTIEKRHLAIPLECFTDVFNYWQQLSFTCQQPVGWTTLVTVLRSQRVDEELLADFIQETFIGNKVYNLFS